MIAEIAVDSPSTSLSDPLTWLNFGALGLILVLLFTGYLWAKPGVDQLRAENKRLIEERDKANALKDEMAEILHKQLLPVVGEFVNTSRSFLPIFQEIQRLSAFIPVLTELLPTLQRIARDGYDSDRRGSR